jgi:hypothetical protein
MLNLLAEASLGADTTRLGALRAYYYTLHKGGVHSCATQAGVGQLPGMGHRYSSFPSFLWSQCSSNPRLPLGIRMVHAAFVIGLGRRSSCKVMLCPKGQGNKAEESVGKASAP